MTDSTRNSLTTTLGSREGPATIGCMMIEYKFLVPITNSASTLADLYWLCNQLLDKFGGYTKDKSKVEGDWINPDTGETVYDESLVFYVAVAKHQQNDHRLKDLLQQVATRFGQQCIYCCISGTHVQFIKRKEESE